MVKLQLQLASDAGVPPTQCYDYGVANAYGNVYKSKPCSPPPATTIARAGEAQTLMQSFLASEECKTQMRLGKGGGRRALMPPIEEPSSTPAEVAGSSWTDPNPNPNPNPCLLYTSPSPRDS